jgi:hypothetical protein
MKTYPYVLVMVLLVGIYNTSIYAQMPTRITTILGLRDNENKPLSVEFGVDDSATDAYENKVDGIAFPNHPPSGFHVGMKIKNEDFMTYKDIKKLESSKTFVKEYEVSVSPGTSDSRTSLEFFWSYPLDGSIDSAIITDKLGGVLVRFMLDSKMSFKITDENLILLENFNIKVYYQPRIVSVDDELQITKSVISPNPTSENLSVQYGGIKQVDVYSVSGQHITKVESQNNQSIEIPTAKWETGVYVLQIIYRDGTIERRKVIKN